MMITVTGTEGENHKSQITTHKEAPNHKRQISKKRQKGDGKSFKGFSVGQRLLADTSRRLVPTHPPAADVSEESLTHPLTKTGASAPADYINKEAPKGIGPLELFRFCLLWSFFVICSL
jgi:hypothetical protein